MHPGGTPGFQQSRAGVVETDDRLSRRQPFDFDVLPVEFGADAGAEGFADGFLGGEPDSEARRGIGMG